LLPPSSLHYFDDALLALLVRFKCASVQSKALLRCFKCAAVQSEVLNANQRYSAAGHSNQHRRNTYKG